MSGKWSNVSAVVLLLLVAIETVVLLVLAYSRFGITYTRTNSTTIHYNPIHFAIEYEAPDRRFEEAVKQNAYLINTRPPGASNSFLAKCAELRKTNHVRILIAHGADVWAALSELKTMKNEEATELLQTVQNEKRR